MFNKLKIIIMNIKEGKLDTCCSMYKNNLPKLLPYIYEKTISKQQNKV